MTFNFKDQLQIGNAGEATLLKHYDVIKVEGEPRYDFVTVATNETVELKTDTHRPKNFFFEFISDTEKATPGGPWRANKDSVVHFVYLFINEGHVFWFETAPLVAFLDEHLAEFRQVQIKNTSWTSVGYLVPIEQVTHLACTKDSMILPKETPDGSLDRQACIAIPSGDSGQI